MFSIKTKSEIDQAIDQAVNPIAERLAEEAIQELLDTKQALLLPKALIKQKKQEEIANLLKMKELRVTIEEGFDVILNTLPHLLTPDEAKVVHENLKEASSRLQSALEMEGETLQQKLGISDFAIKAFYSVAHKNYEEMRYTDAWHVFFVMTLLSPYVRDFWFSFGLASQMDNQLEQSLQAYAMATLLNPEMPASRLQSAFCYLELGMREDAKIEFEEACKTINTLEDKATWQDQVESLRRSL